MTTLEEGGPDGTLSREAGSPSHHRTSAPSHSRKAGSIRGVSTSFSPHKQPEIGGPGPAECRSWTAVSPLPIHTGNQNELYCPRPCSLPGLGRREHGPSNDPAHGGGGPPRPGPGHLPSNAELTPNSSPKGVQGSAMPSRGLEGR